MKPSFLLSAELLLIFSCLIGLQNLLNPQDPDLKRVSASVQKPSPVKYAILVGIDQYADHDVNTLHGCVNDIILMQDFLKQREFQSENITFLSNAQATKHKIFAAFSDVIAKANKDDIVVIHFSCHGSQVKDDRNKETDGLDETIIPYDYKNTYSDAKKSSVVDYEMDSLIGLINAKNTKLTLIIDACHSAGSTKFISKSSRKTLRYIPPKLTHTDSMEIEQQIRRLQHQNSSEKIPPYTLITGCRSDQLSNEYDVTAKVKNGALTYFLITELKNADPSSSLPDIFENVKYDVMKHYPDQTPQLLGNYNAGEIFGDTKFYNQGFFYVSPAAGNTVDVKGGEALGHTVGSIFRVFPPGSDLQDSSTAIATIEITQTSAFMSKAVCKNGSVVLPNSKAVEINHNYKVSPLNVSFLGNWNTDVCKRIKALICSTKGIAENSVAPNLSFISSPEKISIQFSNYPDFTLQEFQAGSPSIDKDMKEAAQTWLVWFRTLRIENPRPGIKLIVDTKVIKNQSKDIHIDKPDLIISDGDSIRLTFKNRSPGPVFVTILDLQDNGHIEPMTLGSILEHPNNDLVPGYGNVTVTIPVWVSEGRDSNLDIMKIFASSEELNFNSLRKMAQDTTGKPIEKFLSKGIGQKSGLNDWTTLTKVLLIRK